MAGNRLSFRYWMNRVDILVTVSTGLSAHDLPDRPYRDWYDSGMSPAEAAREVSAEAFE